LHSAFSISDQKVDGKQDASTQRHDCDEEFSHAHPILKGEKSPAMPGLS
jgi:hypothetical protein